MTDHNTRMITGDAIKQPPPVKCQVVVSYSGKDNSGLDAAREILIASFVNNVITKGKNDGLEW